MVSIKVSEIASLDHLKNSVASLQEQITGTDVYPDDVLLNVTLDEYNTMSGEAKVRWNDIVYYLMDENGDSTTAIGTITSISETELIVDGTSYGLWCSCKPQYFSLMDDLKTDGGYGFDGDVVYVTGYWTVGTGNSQLFRDYANDNADLAGTDWNDNGLINSKLLAYGPNGEAYALNADVITITSLGGVSGGQIDSYLKLAIEFAKLHSKRIIDIDVTKAKLSTVMPDLCGNDDFEVVKMTSTLGLTFGPHLLVDTTAEAPFQYTYGTGGIADTVLTNLHIIKKSAGPLLLLKGLCGAKVYNCYLSTNSGSTVILTNDLGNGTFTEDFAFQNCKIRTDCVMHLIRGNGNNSFDGCGWDVNTDIYLNEDAEQVVLIGDDDDIGPCRWTDANIGGTIFYIGSNPIEFIKVNENTDFDHKVIIKGLLAFKVMTTNIVGVTPGSNGCFAWVGGLSDALSTYQDGDLQRCHQAQLSTDGNIVGDLVPYRKNYLKEEGTTSFELPLFDDGYGLIASISFISSDAYKTYMIRYTGTVNDNIPAQYEILKQTINYSTSDDDIGEITFQALDDGLLCINDEWTDIEITVLMKVITSSGYHYGIPSDLFTLESYI